ncbi:protein ABHD18 isoform X2 [Photinus pyralis]|uniref:protein ABHD18 isoform X2 n=1 Tax=Photinus pyralis TaxID=7054 RepID=UPI001267356F|nr:protein ABHD18 isoform X2 [Photinus pyralis]
MSISRLDKLYRRILLTKFFVKGWGNPNHILRLFQFRKEISNRNKCVDLIPKDYPVTILNEQSFEDYQLIEGTFHSPLAHFLPDVVIPEVRPARFQLIFPKKWKSNTYRPLCIHLAGTGDHHFWKRRNVMAVPLLKHDISALILENPFYGLRKPKDQFRSSLHNVSDIFVMGGCLMLECLVLLRWCESLGFGPLGISGLSMGGHWAPKINRHGFLSCNQLAKTFSACSLSIFVHGICSVYRDMEIPKNKNSRTRLTPFELINLLRSNNYSSLSNEFSNKKNTMMASVLNLNLVNILRDQSIPKLLANWDVKRRDAEAVWFMKGIMDECTHLKNFSIPFDTSLIYAICALHDGYVPNSGCCKLEDVWPQATIRYVKTGHVGAYLWYLHLFRNTIVEAFERAKLVCPPPAVTFS